MATPGEEDNRQTDPSSRRYGLLLIQNTIKCVPLIQSWKNGRLTVGKIYAGFLILENWKTTRFGQIPGVGLSVSDKRVNPKTIAKNECLLTKNNIIIIIIIFFFDFDSTKANIIPQDFKKEILNQSSIKITMVLSLRETMPNNKGY